MQSVELQGRLQEGATRWRRWHTHAAHFRFSESWQAGWPRTKHRKLGGLGEQRQDLIALQGREVRRFAEPFDKLREETRGRREQTRLGGPRAEHEQSRSQPVAERLGVALDEAILGECSQRS